MTSKVECEYFRDGTCFSIMTNDEEKERRLMGCSNSNIRACCFLCSRLQGCEISCRKEVNKNEKVDKLMDDGSKKNSVPTLTCSSCDVVMLNSRMNLRAEVSNKNVPLAMGEIGEIAEELLPVLIYMCPKCGKIEFMAQEKTKQKIIDNCQNF